ncbi:uncharacterized protein PADG_02302 [Paracoccidioides brasiliensis Pb18]|uniref:Uncharacterized protein n=1 Tax=Paracoccidioides brasiliensis (strain Pb18) TaxID=502780 RepID=C1G2D6_PARBD|nr:uncharacterized protein PADG_02302 [Paracoccidioides brasiliensis Pb18]EEH46152.2 hypothetical protein PADG_02302 [Paracoccidioides brasiliensis Pb18]
MYRATPVSTKLSRSLDDEREQPSQTETLVASQTFGSGRKKMRTREGLAVCHMGGHDSPQYPEATKRIIPDRHSKNKMLKKSQFLKTSASVFASPSPALAPICPRTLTLHEIAPRDCSTRLPQVIQQTHRMTSHLFPPPPPSPRRLLELLHERRAANGLIVSTVSPSKPYRGQTGNKDQESDDKASGTPAFSNG